MAEDIATEPQQDPAGRPPTPTGAEARSGWATRRIVWLALGVVAVIALAAWLLVSRREAPAAAFGEALPRDAWVVGQVRRPATALAELQDLGRRLGYPRQMDALRESLTRQLGFDPTDPKALEDRGVDPEGVVAMFQRPDHRRPLLAVSVLDEGRFQDALLALLAARAEGAPGETVQFAGQDVRTAVARDGHVLAAWAFRDGVAFLTAGEEASARVGAALAVAKGGPDGLHAAVRAFGEAEPEGLLWAARGRLEALGVPQAGPAALALRILPDGLELAGWTASGAERVLAALGGPAPTPERLATLSPEAVAAARLSVDLEALWTALKADEAGLPPRLAELDAQLTARGLDVREDVLARLGTPWLADLALATSPDLSRMPAFDARRTNPFEYVAMALTVPVVDPAGLAQRLPDLAAALGPTLVARVTEEEIEGRPAWTVRYRLGEGMTFGLVEDVLLVAGGPGAWARAARRLEGPAAEAPPGAEGLLGEAPFAAVIHVPNVLATVHGLGVESFGGGPGGVMLRSAVRRLSAPLANVARVSATAAPAAAGLTGRVELRLVPERAEAGEAEPEDG